MMTGTKKILLAAPDADSRSLLRNILHDNTALYEAGSSFAALMFLQRNPDTALVVLQIPLRSSDSLETLIYIRLSPWLVNIPIVALAASEDEKSRLRIQKLGATEVLPWPAPPEQLRQRIDALLQTAPPQNDALPGSLAHQMYTLSQSASCGICVYELLPNHTVETIFFNPAYARLCGRTPAEYADLVASGAALQRTIYAEDQAVFQKITEAMAASFQPVYKTIRLQGKNGSIRNISLNAKAYAKCNGHIFFHTISLNLSAPKSSAASPSHRALGDNAFDPLTDIYNRETFSQETTHMLNEHPGREYMLVLWNIDRFKVVNDLFGTPVGDNILVQTAAHLREQLLGIGTFGRLEADSFAFCLPADLFDLDRMLKEQIRLCSGFGIQYNLMMHTGLYLTSDPHIGISQMCDRARMALSTVKGNYIQRYAYYNEDMRQTMLTEQQILNDMHRALAEKEFVIFLQPIYSLNFDKPVSAEVLVRWQHPQLGLLPPSQFIPLFEKNRFISEVDRYIWELACKYIARRQQEQQAPLPFSVNVSRENLASPTLADELLALIRKYQIKPFLLRLEISESAYIENPIQLIRTARHLQEVGFKILLDDFGSGYSSLKMLKDIPLDILKIDMNFLENIEQSSRAAAILLGVIQIAQRLNIVTIAEGVETKFQLDFLRTTGCDNIQGYYYAKPMPVEKFDQFMANPPRML